MTNLNKQRLKHAGFKPQEITLYKHLLGKPYSYYEAEGYTNADHFRTFCMFMIANALPISSQAVWNNQARGLFNNNDLLDKIRHLVKV